MSVTPGRRLTVLALSVVSAALWQAWATAAVQGRPAPVEFRDRVAVWLAAIDGHVPGARDDAVAAVSHWSHADLLGVLNELKRTRDVDALNRRLKKAAMLHADIAMLHRSVNGYALPPADRESAWYMDGRLVSIRSGTLHWEFSRQIVDALRPHPSRHDDMRLWYRATSSFLQAWSEHVELRPHLTRGLQIFEDDPLLLLYGGTMHEALGEPRVQSAVRLPQTEPSDAPFVVTRTTPTTVQPSPATRNATNERRTAEALFRRALQFDPSLAEARIRLGRLLGLRGRHAEAVEELERALTQTTTPRMRFYGLLFLGTSQKALGRQTEAATAFERAARMYPSAQSARLALSQLARDAGDRTGAVSRLQSLILPSFRVSREDPWREYTILHVPVVNELVADLRRSFTE